MPFETCWDLVRLPSASNRYWKATIRFTKADVETTFLSISDVYVLKKEKPRNPGPTDEPGKYGIEFANVSIPPKYIRDRLEQEVNRVYSGCSLDEEKLAPGENRWLKTVNNLKEILTVARTRPEGPELEHKSFYPLMDRVQCGIEVTADLRFSVNLRGTPALGHGIAQLAHTVEVYPSRGFNNQSFDR